MAKGKKQPKAETKQPGPDDEVTVKVFLSERQLINRAAGARGQTVAELFRSIEVQTFLTHLIVGAGDEAKKRLEGQVKPPS